MDDVSQVPMGLPEADVSNSFEMSFKVHDFTVDVTHSLPSKDDPNSRVLRHICVVQVEGLRLDVTQSRTGTVSDILLKAFRVEDVYQKAGEEFAYLATSDELTFGSGDSNGAPSLSQQGFFEILSLLLSPASNIQQKKILTLLVSCFIIFRLLC